jgi:hypothetical protein
MGQGCLFNQWPLLSVARGKTARTADPRSLPSFLMTGDRIIDRGATLLQAFL